VVPLGVAAFGAGEAASQQPELVSFLPEWPETPNSPNGPW